MPRHAIPILLAAPFSSRSPRYSERPNRHRAPLFTAGRLLVTRLNCALARFGHGMLPLAWRVLRFQKDSALARWYQARTADRRAGTRKTMIGALARKLLIALWRFVNTGETLEGVVLRPAD